MTMSPFHPQNRLVVAEFDNKAATPTFPIINAPPLSLASLSLTLFEHEDLHCLVGISSSGNALDAYCKLRYTASEH